MAKRSQKTRKSEEFFVATITENLEQARDYEALLKSNNIPAMVKQNRGDSLETQEYAVVVPEDFLDEAQVIIESQNAYDDFYDYAQESEDDGDFDFDPRDDDILPL